MSVARTGQWWPSYITLRRHECTRPRFAVSLFFYVGPGSRPRSFRCRFAERHPHADIRHRALLSSICLLPLMAIALLAAAMQSPNDFEPAARAASRTRQCDVPTECAAGNRLGSCFGSCLLRRRSSGATFKQRSGRTLRSLCEIFLAFWFRLDAVNRSYHA